VNAINPVAQAGFSRAAEVYERARPSYPQEAVDWIVERAGLGPGRLVVDLAAGTGKLTRLLVPSGAQVVAVEPIAEMRATLLVVVPGVEAIDGTAERLPFADGSVDAVTVGSAFHWFDHARALPELHRVLRPGGVLVLVGNNRNLASPLQRELEDLLARRREGAAVARLDRAWREALERSPLFRPTEERRFAHAQRLTAEGLAERVSSTSFVAAMEPPERDALLAQVRALAAGLDEPFDFPYVTEVRVAARA
jgi:ubiquinone/menaquinone biosynthesis C-methylase UbiE